MEQENQPEQGKTPGRQEHQEAIRTLRWMLMAFVGKGLVTISPIGVVLAYRSISGESTARVLLVLAIAGLLNAFVGWILVGRTGLVFGPGEAARR